MNLEQLNVAELSSAELVETTGGQYCGPLPSQNEFDYDCWCYTMYVYEGATPCKNVMQ